MTDSRKCLGVFGFEIETYMAEVEETLFNWRRRGGGGRVGEKGRAWRQVNRAELGEFWR